jgi:hypothetical protein
MNIEWPLKFCEKKKAWKLKQGGMYLRSINRIVRNNLSQVSSSGINLSKCPKSIDNNFF